MMRGMKARSPNRQHPHRPAAPAASASPRLTLCLAGSPALVCADGRRLPLGGPGGLLAARLALAGPQPRQRLAALLWPDVGDARSRANLRQLLLRLRGLAGGAWIDGEAELALAPTVAVHPDTSGALDDDGGLLEGVDAPGAPELAAWLDGLREARRQRRLQALASAMAAAEADGRLADALAAAQRRLALDPLAESHHRELMRLHYLNQDNAQAWAVHARLRQMLADEFDAEPSAETRALVALIESARRPRLAGAGATRPSPATAQVAAALQRPPRLLGRDAPLAALVRQLQRAGIAWVVGEGGLGKTRLVAEAVQTAGFGPDAGQAWLHIGARPGDAGVPYALAVRALQCLLPLADAAVAASVQTDLAPLLPGVAGPGATAAHAPQAPSHGDLTPRLVAAAQGVLQAAVRQGLKVLSFDDLHLADDASIDLIGALSERGTCALLLALRPAEAGEVLTALRQRLEARADTLSLVLQPLDAAAVAALLESLALDGLDAPMALAQADSLHAHTGGNPMYLLETLKVACERGLGVDAAVRWPQAPNVLRLIGQRLARLSPLALKVARCAAVAGADMTPQLVARLLGTAALDLAPAWAELDAAHILHARGFAHDLIAEAVQAALPAAVAEPLHAEVAALLAAADAEPARVAEHWLAAREPLRAVPCLRAAARRAAALWRHREASRLQLHAATLLQAADRPVEAFELLFEAIDTATDLGDVEFVRQAEPMLSATAAAAPDRGRDCAVAFVRSWLLYHLSQQDQALAMAQAALPMACHASARVEVLMLQHLSTMLWERRRVRESLDAAERALARIESTRTTGQDGALRGLRLAMTSLAGMAWCALARYGPGCSRIEESWRIATAQHERFEVSYATRLLALITLFCGDLAAAGLWADRAREAMLAAEQEGTTQEAYMLAALCSVQTAQGDLGAALACSERIIALHEQQPTGPVIINAEERSVLLAELGRRDLARAAVPALAADIAHTDVQRARRNAARAGLGLATVAEIDHALQVAAETEDFNLRARILWMAQPGLAPARIAPLLAEAAAQAAEHGGHGLWTMLQSRRLAALRGLDGAAPPPARAAEARAVALALWPRLEAGVCGMETFARMAGELCATLAPTDPDLAETIALRAGSWMLRAAATLPPGWRENYLQRAWVLDTLPPRERAVLTALGIAAMAP